MVGCTTSGGKCVSRLLKGLIMFSFIIYIYIYIMYGDGEAQWISDLEDVRNKLLRFLSTLLGRGVCLRHRLTKSIILAQN